MIHYVYLTTNLINGKKYIGDHSTNKLNDNYIGSGRPVFKSAIKKYGRENFKREILEFFETKEEAFNAQEKYINQFNTLIPFGYNISPKGGHCKSSGPWSNKKLSEKHKQNISNKLKGIKTWNKGIPCSDNTKRKISNSEKGKILSEHTKTKMSEASKGRPKSKEHAEKCRVANLGKKHPKIYCMHCKKYYADYMYILYHGEKCKLRK